MSKNFLTILGLINNINDINYGIISDLMIHENRLKEKYIRRINSFNRLRNFQDNKK